MTLHFAYGSNLDRSQMLERAPSARFHCRAKLKDHRLAFTRKSIKRECGVADAVPEPHHDVWGVVYEIDEDDLARLDEYEGFRPGRQSNAYTRCEGCVLQDGDEARPLTAWIYFAEQQTDPPLPNEEYKRLLVEGAKSRELPQEYIRELEQIEVAP